MEEKPVVTCFIQNCGDILLLYREDDLSSYPNRWSGVSGYIEYTEDGSREKPKKTALREIREETGLSEDEVDIIKKGKSFFVEDSSLGKKWEIYPFLFNSDRRNIDINWESKKAEWVQPSEILCRKTVPSLWRSYKKVSPTIADLIEESRHGSSYILARSIELIRDEAAEMMEKTNDKDGIDKLKNLGNKIIDSYPSMAALSNRIKKITNEKSIRKIKENAEKDLKEVLKANKDAAKAAKKIVSGKTVLTISRSETVRRALEEDTAKEIYISESRPGKEGIEFGDVLSAEVIYDSEIPKIVSKIDLVLIGADSLLLNGDVINKVGSMSGALAAKREGIPFYVVASTDKIKKENIGKKEKSDIFEIIPSDLVTKIITEKGIFTPNKLESVI